MKGKAAKETDPLPMKASEFDRMMRHALGVKPEPTKRKTAKKAKKKTSKTMAFPLVTPDDLVSWLRALEPHIRLDLEGSQSRKKPAPLKDDRIVVLNAKAVQ